MKEAKLLKYRYFTSYLKLLFLSSVCIRIIIHFELFQLEVQLLGFTAVSLYFSTLCIIKHWEKQQCLFTKFPSSLFENELIIQIDYMKNTIF